MFTLNQYQTGAEPAQGTYDESKNYTPLNYILSLNPVEYFTLANQLMVENPPAAEDADAIAAMAAINVGPGLEFNPAVLGENASENWISMLCGMTAMLTASTQGFLVQNGIWSCYGSPIGEYSTEYNYRALVALGGLGANPLSVAMYLKTTTDSEGNRLSGDHTYVLHFDADQLPPVEEYGFWSITAYNSENNLLIDNVLDRYCINDRSDLQYNEDGSLDISLQFAEPQEGQENWLPVNEGPFHLFLRIYLPSDEALNGEWSAPTIQCVD